jgi:phosphate transport system substrate-binding protein
MVHGGYTGALRKIIFINQAMAIPGIKNLFIVMLLLPLFFLGSCTNYEKRLKSMPDYADSGMIHVSCDESFKPIVEELVKVYESDHRKTKIIVTYKPEAECLDDLLVDSVRMIIATRRANEYERAYIVDSFKTDPVSKVTAYDAISVIAHPDNPDSLLTMDDIRKILTGKFRKNLIPVFDGVKATSTVRFIIDSILSGDSLTKTAVAGRSSQGVIDYVAQTKDAIGFIGVSWIGNPEDSAHLRALKKVKAVQIERTDAKGRCIYPTQPNIYLRRYPMIRELVYTVKERHPGLGNSFANFMDLQIGQLIFHRAYLVPAWIDYFKMRAVKITEE